MKEFRVEGHKINRLDLSKGIIDIDNFFTVLPVSSPSYRAKTPTKYSLCFYDSIKYAVFHVTDDWGKSYIIYVPKTEENKPFIEKNIEYATE